MQISLFQTIGNIEIRGWYAATTNNKRRASVVCHECHRGVAFETTQTQFDSSPSPAHFSLQCLEATLEFLHHHRGCSHTEEAKRFLILSRKETILRSDENDPLSLPPCAQIKDLICFDGSQQSSWQA